MSSYDPTKDVRFRDFISTLSENEIYNGLNCSYCTENEFNQKFGNMSRNNIALSIFHLNIRSLNANQSKLLQLLENLDLNLDLIVLSEVWSYNIQFYKNILLNYTLYYDLPSNSNIGGVGVFVNNKLYTKLREDLNLTIANNHKFENVWLEIKKGDNVSIVGAIYRHPNQSINDFSRSIDFNLQKLSSRNIPCYIIGDINVDFLKYDF